MLQLGLPAWELVVRSVVVYSVLLVALRVFGKREVGQFTLYDLVLILLVANAVQPAMTGPDTSLTGGLLIIGSLVVLNATISRLDQNRLLHRLLVPAPRTIIRNGKYNTGAMAHEGIDKQDAQEALREHGVDNVADVKLGVLEPDGSISVVAKHGRGARPRRRVRYVRHG